MKKILFAFLMFAAVPTFAQFQPAGDSTKPKATEFNLQMNRAESDSMMSIIGTISQKIATVACLTQGEAAQYQTLLNYMYATMQRRFAHAVNYILDKDVNEPRQKQKKN